MIAADSTARHRFHAGLHIHHLLAFFRHGDGFVFIGDEAMAGRGGNQQLATRHMHEHGHDVGFGRQVDEAADGFAIAAAAGQLRSIKRIEAPIGGEHHDLVGGLGRELETAAIAFAVLVVL